MRDRPALERRWNERTGEDGRCVGGCRSGGRDHGSRAFEARGLASAAGIVGRRRDFGSIRASAIARVSGGSRAGAHDVGYSLEPFGNAAGVAANDALKEGGKVEQCGWLRDRWGLSWQIVPKRLGEMMSDPDRDKAKRVAEANLSLSGACLLARLSHSGWRVELPAGAGSTIFVAGIRRRPPVSGGGGLGGCPVLFVGGRNERSQAAAARGGA